MARHIAEKQWVMVIEKTVFTSSHRTTQQLTLDSPSPQNRDIKHSGICNNNLHAVNGDWAHPKSSSLSLAATELQLMLVRRKEKMSQGAGRRRVLRFRPERGGGIWSKDVKAATATADGTSPHADFSWWPGEREAVVCRLQEVYLSAFGARRQEDCGELWCLVDTTSQ
ncbi:MAG: hypothetical protein Q9197_006819 [Variospora fuerteventurae]